MYLACRRHTALALLLLATLIVTLLLLPVLPAHAQLRGTAALLNTTNGPALQRFFGTRPYFTWEFGSAPLPAQIPSTAVPTYHNGYASHTGLLEFTGTPTSFADLRSYTDDRNNTVTDYIIGGDMTLEVWGAYDKLTSWSRLFDVCGPNFQVHNNNLFVGNELLTNNLALGMRYETGNNDAGDLISSNTISLHQWMHVVAVFRVNPGVLPSSYSAISASTKSLYINGVLVAQALGQMPPLSARANGWFGKSSWFNFDGMLNGRIDTVNFYGYAVSNETVQAHAVLPHYPALELTFETNPSSGIGASPSYSWLQVDSSDTTADQVAHSGLVALVAAQSQLIDLLATSGASSVSNATLLPLLGGQGWRDAQPGQVGWSFETTVKFTPPLTAGSSLLTIAGNASTAAAANTVRDSISIGLSPLNPSTFTVSISNARTNRAFSLDAFSGSVQTLVWYHLVVVVEPISVASATARISVYLNGQLVGFESTNGVWLDAFQPVIAIVGADAQLTSSSFVTAVIDSVRIHDTALSLRTIAKLTTVVNSGTNALPNSAASAVTTTNATSVVAFTTGPTQSFNFDWDAPYVMSVRPIGQFDAALAGRYGVATARYVDLAVGYDQDWNGLTRNIGGDAFSFEMWAYFTSNALLFPTTILSIAAASGSSDKISLVWDTTGFLTVAIYTGTATAPTSQLVVNRQLAGGNWTHIVVTVAKNALTIASNASNACTIHLYLNGQHAGSAFGPLPLRVPRAQALIGATTNTLYTSVDAFHYYNYALDPEQVLVHARLPRVPSFELTFRSDSFTSVQASPAWTRSSAILTAMNQNADVTDPASVQALHIGLLQFSGASARWIDLAPTASANTTTLSTAMPMFGSLVGLSKANAAMLDFVASNKTARTGLSFEFVFKTTARVTDGLAFPLFACGDARFDNNVQLAWVYDNTTGVATLQFQVGSLQPLSSSSSNRSAVLTVATNPTAGVWYHVAVVARITNTTAASLTASYDMYVNGMRVSSVSNAPFPYESVRPSCYLGRGLDVLAPNGTIIANNTAYYMGYIDAFRVYDYALLDDDAVTLASVYGLYVASIIVPPISSTAPSMSSSALIASSSAIALSSSASPPSPSFCPVWVQLEFQVNARTLRNMYGSNYATVLTAGLASVLSPTPNSTNFACVHARASAALPSTCTTLSFYLVRASNASLLAPSTLSWYLNDLLARSNSALYDVSRAGNANTSAWAALGEQLSRTSLLVSLARSPPNSVITMCNTASTVPTTGDDANALACAAAIDGEASESGNDVGGSTSTSSNSNSSLSNGEIAGVVIGSVAGALLCCLLLWVLLVLTPRRKFNQQEQQSSATVAVSPVIESGAKRLEARSTSNAFSEVPSSQVQGSTDAITTV